MNVREKEPADQPWIETLLNERWGGGGNSVVHGETFDARSLTALIACERQGLATFQIRRSDDIAVAELITLDALTAGRGVGTVLIEALISRLQAARVEVLRVTTTNDNLEALRFYQRRGFRITEARPGAVDKARRIKSSIPMIGEHGIPIHDEIELERPVQE
jgi:ribosomal protein S18 acetylase RimI-like enzyme